MRCPRDGSTMLHETFGAIEVDLCPHCAGAWFDAFELDRLTDADAPEGTALADRLEELQRQAAPIDTTARIASPLDPEVVMMRRFADPEHEIEIDECPVSGGVWLDAGELATLRARFPDETARAEAAREVIDRVMSCPDFHLARAQEQAQQARANRLARVLSAVVPWSKAGSLGSI